MSGNTGMSINVDLSANKNLKSLDLSGCTGVTGVTLASPALEYLNCSHTNMSKLDVSACTALISLDCSNTKIAGITSTATSGSNALSLLKNPNLRSLKCDNLGITNNTSTSTLKTFDVTGCTELRELSLSWQVSANTHQSISTLDLSNCTKLETLNCSGNTLTALDVSKCPKLETLNCSNNSLTSLTLGENDALTSLTCDVNSSLNEIDISGCTKLTKDLVHGDNNLIIHSVPKFHSQALILRSDLGLVFNIEWPNDDMTNYFQSNTSMSFDINNGEASSIFDGANATADKDNTEIFSYECPVNSIQIADPVSAYFAYTKQNIVGDADAGKTTIITKNYSVQTYLDAAMKDNTYTVQGNTYFRSEELQNLLMAIKDFGHYVQPVLSKTNGWKLGTDHAVINAANEDYSAFVTSAKNALGKYKSIITDTNSGLKVEYTLELESLTRLLVCLIPDDETVTAVSATLDGGAENVAVYYNTEKCYLVEIPEIRPQLMSKDHTIAVTTTKSDNSTGTMNIKISALSYANAILNPESGTTPDMGHGITTDEIKNAAAAIYHYCDCTKKYRDKNGYTD